MGQDRFSRAIRSAVALGILYLLLNRIERKKTTMNENRLAFLESSISAIHDSWIQKFGAPVDASALEHHLAARLRDWDKYVGSAMAGQPAQLPLLAGTPVLPPSTGPSTNRTMTLDSMIADIEARMNRSLTPEERAGYERAFAPPPVTP